MQHLTYLSNLHGLVLNQAQVLHHVSLKFQVHPHQLQRHLEDEDTICVFF